MSSLVKHVEALNLPLVSASQVPAAVLDAAFRSKLTVRITSPSAPEQYELLRDGEQSGYIRVRWGVMSVSYPDAGGELLYQGPTEGFGGFVENERELKLLFALSVIAARMNVA